MGFFCGLRKVAFLISKTNDERERGGGRRRNNKGICKKKNILPFKTVGGTSSKRKRDGW
jgi:hypothetical protein